MNGSCSPCPGVTIPPAAAGPPPVAFVHGRPAPHWLHARLAESVGATFVPVDFFIRWNGLEDVPRLKRYVSWMVCSLFFPRRNRYSIFLSEGCHVLPVLMARLGLLRSSQRTAALMDNETLYFICAGFYSGSTCRWLRRVISSYDALICVGRMQTELAGELVKAERSATRIWTIPSALSQRDCSRLARLAPALRKPHLAFLGHLLHPWRCWYKGVDLLIEAVKQLAPEFEGLRLRVAGDVAEECRQDIRRRAGPGPASWLEFVGPLEDLAPLFEDASL